METQYANTNTYVKHPCAIPRVQRLLLIAALFKARREVLEEEAARIQEGGIIHDFSPKVNHLILGTHKNSFQPLVDDKPAPRVLPTQKVQRFLGTPKLGRIVDTSWRYCR